MSATDKTEENIDKAIKSAWQYTVFFVIVQGILPLFAMVPATTVAWGALLIPDAIILGLAYGVANRSRPCAVALTILLGCVTLVDSMVFGFAKSALIIVCAVLAARGTWAVFQYHKRNEARDGELGIHPPANRMSPQIAKGLLWAGWGAGGCIAFVLYQCVTGEIKANERPGTLIVMGIVGAFTGFFAGWSDVRLRQQAAAKAAAAAAAVPPAAIAAPLATLLEQVIAPLPLDVEARADTVQPQLEPSPKPPEPLEVPVTKTEVHSESPAVSESSTPSFAAEIRALAGLLKDGLITEAEFIAKKHAILGINQVP